MGTDAKWATIAVVTEQDTKESAKGNVYGIWRLSDLQGTNVSLFLSGKAQADLSKETEGSLVALFNPEVPQDGPSSPLMLDHVPHLSVMQV